ncbi:MAG: SGNH/GDSL hydrolase family protein [Spirochaetaceae bacterium]|nr:SGNH/GDSL hydrolase family protein [Spirochaetaceae bacterium]
MIQLNEVCMFGDSVARGIILDEHGSYVPIKDSFGAEAAQRLGIGFVNKARFGCTITKGLKIVSDFLKHNILNRLGPGAAGSHTDNELVTAKPAPQLALLEFGGNDCDFHWAEIAADPAGEHQPLTPVDTFCEVYGQVISSLREQNFTPVLLTLPPLDAKRYFDWFTRDGLDKDAIMLWLGDVQYIYRWHEGYNDAVWETAMKYGCPVIDIRRGFLQHKCVSDLLCLDGIHPNREGHKVIEKTILDYAAQAIS